MNIGNPDKTLYSTGLDRFPAWFDPLPSWIRVSIFYFIEITEPYTNVHPISFLLYAVGLVGLGWLAVRRKAEDKYLLIWFAVVYIFFTAIPNRQWRYLIPVFPVLAISGASLIISALDKAQKTWKLPHLSVSKKRLVQVAAGLLVVFTLVGTTYSVSDAYSWVAADQIHIPIQEATDYAAAHLARMSRLWLCVPRTCSAAVWSSFTLMHRARIYSVFQYPAEPVDAYTPVFNITEFVQECSQNNVKYVFTYEYGGDVPYFNTTLTAMGVFEMLYQSGQFQYLSGNAMMENLR